MPAKTKSNKTSKSNLVSAFDLFPKSYKVFSRNMNTFIILLIIPFIPTLISLLSHPTRRNNPEFTSLFGISISTHNWKSLIGIGLVALLVFGLITITIQTMLHILQLEGSSGKTPSLSHLWNKMKHYWLRMLGLYIVVGIMTVVGFILLIVPGLIVIRRYFLAPYILLDKDLSISEAMRRSADMSKPYSGAIWGVIGVTILFQLTSIVPIAGAVIAYVLAALYSVAPALRYQEIKKLA